MQKANVNTSVWLLIGDNPSSISFQNLGQYGVYINFSDDANTAPNTDVGFLYRSGEGELKITLANWSLDSNSAAVWAKAATQTAVIVYETS